MSLIGSREIFDLTFYNSFVGRICLSIILYWRLDRVKGTDLCGREISIGGGREANQCLYRRKSEKKEKKSNFQRD